MSGIDNTNAIIRKFEPLLEGLSNNELTILNQMVVARLRLMQKAGALISISKFNVGNRVSWNGRDGTVRVGVIIRLNQKTASITTGNKEYWNVSPQLLRKED